MKYLIELDLDDDAFEENGGDLGEMLEAVSSEMIGGDETEGVIRPGLGDPVGRFRTFELPDRDLVPDRRQRVAAANLLMAVDLPQEMGEWAKHMMLATLVCPGMTTGDLPDRQSRLTGLEASKRLIESMIVEIGEVRAGALTE